MATAKNHKARKHTKPNYNAMLQKPDTSPVGQLFDKIFGKIFLILFLQGNDETFGLSFHLPMKWNCIHLHISAHTYIRTFADSF